MTFSERYIDLSNSYRQQACYNVHIEAAAEVESSDTETRDY